MLGNIDAAANLAVKDLTVARNFYEGTLGLTPVGSEGDELIVYRSGKTMLNVYTSQEAGTNKATAVTWAVGDQVEDVVRALKAKGRVRALRHAGHDFTRRHPRRRRHEGRLVQGPGRQHSQHRQSMTDMSARRSQ